MIIVGLALGVTGACVASPRGAPAGRHVSGGHWVATWVASPEADAPGGAFTTGFRDETIRNIIYTSVGGSLARVRLDNTFGPQQLVIGRATIGVVQRGAALVPGTDVALTFAGRTSAAIPSGGQLYSDPVHLAVRPLELLAVSVYLPASTGAPTQHTDTHQVNYLATGNHVLAARGSVFKTRIEPWYFLSGLDVWSPRRVRGAVVALGDSITDGNGSSTGANGRWPNDLARRLNALPGATLSAVNAGIDGNRLLNAVLCCGPSALDRFTRDVADQAGARGVIVLEGINDIGYSSSTSPLTVPHRDVSAQQIIAGYEQLIVRAHAAGLKIYGATLTPFRGSQHWTPAGEAKREAINAWIRSSGAFDGVIDFARAVADPNDPQRLNPRYDDGDHLHPSEAGYEAMSDAVSLVMLVRG
jgi:lysophospholipase L1-like esterase